MKIGLLGCGTIGKSIAKAILEGKIEGSKLVIVGDAVENQGLKAIAQEHGCIATTEISSFLHHPLDLVVEAAGHEAVFTHVPMFLQKGINVMIMSVGAFAELGLYEKLHNLALENNCNIYIPSGAIGCLDLLATAKMAHLERVTLITRKPPLSLEKVVDGRRETYAGVQEPIVVYEGLAREAVKDFPKNVNVAAALSLAGIGFDHTMVKIIADPGVTENIHEVEAEGEFGHFKVTIENKPSPENPRTSYIACLSGIAMLAKINSRIKIGT